LEQYDDLPQTKKVLESRLIRDFYEIPDYPGQAIRPVHQQYGYPTGRAHEVKRLSGEQIWGQFQQVVEAEFYDEFNERCIDYHDYLKGKSS
jgi:hypothetical protein